MEPAILLQHLVGLGLVLVVTLEDEGPSDEDLTLGLLRVERIIVHVGDALQPARKVAKMANRNIIVKSMAIDCPDKTHHTHPFPQWCGGQCSTAYLNSVQGVGGPTVAQWPMTSALAMNDAAHVSVRP
jgi:hypothetical protein